MKRTNFKNYKVARTLFMLAFLVMSLSVSASAQWGSRIPIGKIGEKLVDIKVGEITLESIDFRDQTARLNVGLDIRNSFVPVSLKDFDYRLSLFNQELIEGRHNGTLRVSRNSRVNLPLVVNLRSIPGVVWQAFSNRGRVSYQLDTGFTLPLYVMERRFDQSFSGEVPLRSLVDAASILRARRW
ncbi:MAG: hypothetical protein ICV68_08155 [Pyrinomonadaceae bacterium]|nr:hypothetical protein [Pyrinomonadaceae bacterium]